MGKTAKDPVPGAVAKAEDVPDPSTVPSAPPGSGGEYEYYEETAEYVGDRNSSGTMTQRPLPAVPVSGAPGQSRTQTLGGAETEAQGNNALSRPTTGHTSGQHDAFILRNLPNFKGEYNGTAITDWVQKVDLLIRLTKILDASLLTLLLLRV